LSDVVSEASAVSFLDGILTTIEKQPDLILNSHGEASEHLRHFVQRAARSLLDAPFPFNWRDGLATEIMGAALDAAADIATSRLRANLVDLQNPHEWDETWASIAETLVRGFVNGLQQGSSEGVLSFADFEKAIGLLFTRQQAAGLVKLIADSIAAQPSLLHGRDSKEISDEVQAITRDIATLIASDDKTLLRGDDWLEILSVALAMFAEHPTILVSTGAAVDASNEETTNRPSQEIGMALISSLLKMASRQITLARTEPGNASGAIFFGATLRKAMIATLGAAQDAVVSALSTDQRAERLEAFETFSEQLAQFVHGQVVAIDDGNDVVEIEMRLGAKDWLRAYVHFIAHVMQYGLHDPIEDQDIVRLFHQLDPGITVSVVPATWEEEG